jgi:S-formylglutathione hydrolase FrmB
VSVLKGGSLIVFGVPLDPAPSPSPPPPPAPTPIPQLPAPNFHGFNHGISLLGGWFPITVEIVTVVLLVVVIGWRTRRWRLLWVPLGVAMGVAAAIAARTYMNSQGLASDPAPSELWVWVAICVGAIAVAIFGWRGARWWRRGLSVLVIPMTVLAVLLTLNQWVGYYRTLQAAWNAVTAGPLPDQIEAGQLPGMRNTVPATGKLVKVNIPDSASGFKHRSEYVYLPPAWFAGHTAPPLPAIMMIAGEFDTPADWMRSGEVIPILDGFAQSHGGAAPLFVFVDSGGRFNNDTECVNGPRGNVADHLTKDVRGYVISQFNASSDPANWAVVGWSAGGTCALDLTVMHPELFSAFEDIAGDRGPTAGTKQQTIDRLYGGNGAQWDAFDPMTVMTRHGPYTGVSGWFDEARTPPMDQYGSLLRNLKARPQPSAPLGYGGHDEWRGPDPSGLQQDLCAAATKLNIPCSVHTMVSFHTWQFATKAFSEALPWLAATVHTPPPGAVG